MTSHGSARRLVGKLRNLLPIGGGRRARPTYAPRRAPLTHLADYKGTWRWSDQRYSRRRRFRLFGRR